MSDHAHTRLRRAQRAFLVAAAAGAAGAIALGIHAPEALGTAYRFAVLACLAPCLGSLMYLLISYSTGGQWADGIRPVLALGARAVPWVWAFFIPALVLWPTTARALPADDHFLRIYLSPTALLVRAFVYGLIFVLFARLCRTETSAAGGDSAISENPAAWPPLPHRLHLAGARRAGFGPVGLIVLTFTLHLLAVDAIFSLEPSWYSTSFPLVWMVGQSVSGLALAVLVNLWLGHDPAKAGTAGRAIGLDWGNLLLTSTVFWVYVGFMQFLIIWSGNIPREISWYVHRSSAGWRVVLVVLAVVHLAIPFFALLSRRVKQSRRSLAMIAALLLFSQCIYTAWMILPASLVASSWSGLGLAAALLLAGGSLLLNRFLHRLGKSLPS